jgi:hypothetical protein
MNDELKALRQEVRELRALVDELKAGKTFTVRLAGGDVSAGEPEDRFALMEALLSELGDRGIDGVVL